VNKDFEDMYKGIIEKCERQDKVNSFKSIWNTLQEMIEGGFTMEYAMLFMAIMAKFNGQENQEDED
jgi:hypothetical protein